MLFPSEETIKKAKKLIRNEFKRYDIEYPNTESRRDRYKSELYLHNSKKDIKVKIIHYSGVLDYPIFQEIWKFAQNEEKLANNVFEDIKQVLENIKEKYYRSMMPPVLLSPMIKESVKPICISHQIKTKNPIINASESIVRESDWRDTIYGGRYKLDEQKENETVHFDGKQEDALLIRKEYKSRQKY